MSPEADSPRSIFTAKGDFKNQHIRGGVAPPTSGSPPRQGASPAGGEEGREPTAQANTQLQRLVDSVQEAQKRASNGWSGRGGKEDLETVTQTNGQLPPLEIERVPQFRKPSPSPTQAASVLHVATTQTAKHPRSEDRGMPVSTEPPSKRNRAKPRPRQSLNPKDFIPSFAKAAVTSPTSPLFFSHSPRTRPTLPSAFSSADAVATMLKPREEHSGFTTLKLARGSMSAASPHSTSSTPERGRSYDHAIFPKSPGIRAKPSPGVNLLGSVGVVELLEQDERPTFIIDISNPENFIPGGPLQIIFANATLRASESVLELVTGTTDLTSPGVAVTNDFPAFKQWAISFVKDGRAENITMPSFVYAGLTWTCKTLRKQLRTISGSGSGLTAAASSRASSMASGSSILSGRFRPANTRNSFGVSSPLAQSLEPADYFGDLSPPQAEPEELEVQPLPREKSSSPPKQGMLALQNAGTTSFDWTRIPVTAALPKHIQFARSIDWSKTPLGPIEDWDFSLRSMCNLIMGSPHPAAFYWGPEYVAIYNEAYILLAGKKHPGLMGTSYKEAWAEIWDSIEGVFSSARETGLSTMKDDDCLFIKRNGYLEESYFSWSIVPLVGEDGSVVGLYNPAFEKTRRKIAERRMLTLREIGEATAAARDVKGFWGQVIKGLEYNEYDVPFALLYSVGEDPDSDISSMHSGSLAAAPQCFLEGTLGIPPGHRAAISPLDFKTSEDGFTPHFRESMRTSKPVLLTTANGSLSHNLIDGFIWRGFGDPCRAAVVCPIQPTTGENVLGFLVIGVNPRRPYDDDYSLFIQLLSRQLATSMASVVLFEEEIKRGQRAARLAALDRQELSKQLDLRTQEAVESETKFTRMAEFAPVGMFIADYQGRITYSNDTWWEISRHPRSENSANTWMGSIKDEDREGVKQVWKTLVDDKKAVTHEFRFKTPWRDRNGNLGDTWALLSAYPERNNDGELKSVFGCITNISQQKWAEGFQKQRMEEAIELKRQQENFIDMTSHEMRNPLSAILQSSDEISSSLAEFKTSEDAAHASGRLFEVLDSSIDAAQTIALCAQHQKRIVDDILTLSKLDSAMLMVTPVAIQPVAVVQRALKMFEGELDTNDIAMEFQMERSYIDLAIDWVKLDPSRLLQVLINLTTNAIKFTHGQEKRTIVVSVGASLTRPDGSESDVTYFPTRSKRKDITTDESEWGSGEALYLLFSVQDTGRGLDKKEKTLLFQRFSQASPRTHVQYGGSGLGLFISRQLTELQGGEIGVSSERGVGSTFAFYVKARRVEGISEDTPIAATINSLRRNSSKAAVTMESKGNSTGIAVHRSNPRAGKRSTPPLLTPTAPPAVKMSKMPHSQLTILIVEDNLVNQRVLQKQLRNLGFPIVLANHGGEAVDYLKVTNFWKGNEKDGKELAVILMDLEMPVMDGLTCARKIREMEQDGTIVRHVPIIAVTANARMEQIETAMSAGMDDVVSKPFRIPELIPKIEELVTKFNVTTPMSPGVGAASGSQPART